MYMKSSGIGGQAVIEGIMMKNKDKYAIAVRKPNQEIEVDVRDTNSLAKKYKVLKLPIIRGIYNFVSSLVEGMKILTYSASFFEEEEEKPSKADEALNRVFKDKAENVVMGITVAFSIVFAVGLFMVLPYVVSELLRAYIGSPTLMALIEGVIRLSLFIGYILLITLMKDIQRVFMYHGAEHKCINCIESGLPLTVENVKVSSRFHKRCGTSFLLIVMVISIIFFIFIRTNNSVFRLFLRILLVPVIAGVSYEFIRLAGMSDNKFVNFLSKPGLLLQRLTTKEPDESMIQVGIKSGEAVFDWEQYLLEEGVLTKREVQQEKIEKEFTLAENESR